MREFRAAHEVFARLGAQIELDAVRTQIRELGAGPPSRTMASGMAGLTGRELEIARMVSRRKSNKEIGASLDISSRTVSTHLSNIFAKVGVGSRGELGRLRLEPTSWTRLDYVSLRICRSPLLTDFSVSNNASLQEMRPCQTRAVVFPLLTPSPSLCVFYYLLRYS